MECCLPWDLIVEILCRLPVKSLVRFRCISKRWRSEISDPKFIRLHLQQSTHDSTHSSLVICEAGKLNFVHLSNPLNPISFSSMGLIGICNGLVCLSHYDCIRTAVWNISTREHMILPPRPVPDLGNYVQAPVVHRDLPIHPLFGFGYDPVSDDYKVIMIYDICEHKALSYSLRSKSWRMVPGLSNWFCLTFCRRGVYAHGAIHWLGTSCHDCDDVSYEPAAPFTVAINLSTYKQRILVLPHKDGRVVEVAGCRIRCSYRILNIGVLGGNLCAMGSFHRRHYMVDVWMMNTYGVTESWSCLFSLPLASYTDHRGPYYDVHPLMFCKNGEEVLVALGGGVLFYYNIKTRHIKHVHIPIFESPCETQIYHQSLVPLHFE